MLGSKISAIEYYLPKNKENNAVFKKKIVPGDVTIIYAHLESFKRGIAKGKAHSEVNGEIACSAEFLVSVPAILDKFKPK